MSIRPSIAILVALLTFASPAVALAQAPASSMAMTPPTSTMVKNALKATNPSLSQMRKIAPMVENYKSQTANMAPADKQAASKTLLKNVMGVLTPAQQTTFKQSLSQQMMAAH